MTQGPCGPLRTLAKGSQGQGGDKLQTWLGWLDSNQRMRESKSRALPLGYTPMKKSGKAGADAPALSHGMGWVMGLEPTTPGTTIRCSAN